MIWLLWRQHRAQLALAGVAVALFALPLSITGVHLADALSSCRASNSCGGVNLFRHYNVMNTLVDLTIVVPLLVGVFWGTTIVGKELESGTATLVWTQSVTRRRWLTAKVLSLFAFAAACGAAVTGLVTWWSNAHNAAVDSRFDGIQFDIQGIAPVAYTLFAAALGLAAGALWRRLLPAMATTIGGFIAARLVVESYLRQHLLTPIVKTSPMSASVHTAPGAWWISTDLMRHGQVINGPVNSCRSAATREAANRCMDALGYRVRVTYLPASRYWPVQFIESAIFVGLAISLVLVAVLAVRRHDA